MKSIISWVLIILPLVLFCSLAFGAWDKNGKWYDTSIKTAAVSVAKARLGVATADEQACLDEFQHYKTEWNRAQTLFKTGAISHSEYTEISRKHVRSKGECLRSKARTAEAKALLEYAEITGEIDKALTNRHD